MIRTLNWAILNTKDISGPDGVPDGKISPEYDRVLLGSSLPHFLYGGNINLGYKNFDLSLAFQGVGKQNARLAREMVEPFRNNYGNFPAIIDGNYWSPYNTDEQNAVAKISSSNPCKQKSNLCHVRLLAVQRRLFPSQKYNFRLYIP